jgi:NADPH:quinone reductase-like Zn-dependent oxidoreductase
VAAGRIPVPIARRMPLAAAVDAHRLLEAGGLGGKIILEPR